MEGEVTRLDCGRDLGLVVDLEAEMSRMEVGVVRDMEIKDNVFETSKPQAAGEDRALALSNPTDSAGDRALALSVYTFNAKGQEAIAGGQPALAAQWFEQGVEAVEAAQGEGLDGQTKALLYSNLGDAYAKCGRLADAKRAFHASVAIEPDFGMGWFNLGVLVDETTGYNGVGDGPVVTGREYYEKSLRSRVIPGALNNLANIALHEKRLEDARELYMDALAHQWMASSYNLSLTMLMLAGAGLARWRDAWRCYEWRPQMVEFRKNDRLWRGEALAGKTLVVYLEQGLGDCVWALRWLKKARELGAARIYVATVANMAPLVAAQPYVDQVWATDSGTPPPAVPFDYVTMAGSMALYLDPDGKERTWGKYLELDRPIVAVPGRVGLCWSGSVDRGYQRFRDIDVRLLAPLGRCLRGNGMGWDFVSLQKGKRAADAEEAGFAIDTRPIEACRDMLDTARLVASCELVITVDTVIPHLAAALSRPTWLMNRWSSCWQWGVEYGDPNWYMTLMQFRQPEFGSWGPVVDQVRQCLDSL